MSNLDLCFSNINKWYSEPECMDALVNSTKGRQHKCISIFPKRHNNFAKPKSVIQYRPKSDDFIEEFCSNVEAVSYTHLTLPTILRV